MKNFSDDPFDGLFEIEAGLGTSDSRHDIDEEDLTPALEDVDVLDQVVILIRKVGLERLVDVYGEVVNRYSPHADGSHRRATGTIVPNASGRGRSRHVDAAATSTPARGFLGRDPERQGA